MISEKDILNNHISRLKRQLEEAHTTIKKLRLELQKSGQHNRTTWVENND
jgi:chaperonin cofactor prefoldin|tara:strand:+ start:292 stop:441 length:150 start_codon:yes stop_codon:yes gene_type:complete